MKGRLKDHRFHFIGVGGIGVCGLAEILHNMGAKVSGSDIAENANTARLKKLGVRVFIGHAAGNVEDVDVVVHSSAISKANPEMQAARARSIPLIQRGEALAELMRLKRGIAVGGTHGKTTTTSMIGAILMHASSQPTIYVGGRINTLDSTVRLGEGEWMVAESDESDNSFNRLNPEIAIITNIDSDHLDYYKSMENLKLAFFSFASRIPFYGAALVWGDDPAIREVFNTFPKKILYYGFNNDNDIQIAGEKGEYEYFENGKKLGAYRLQVPGRHNALNGAVAITAAMRTGLSFEKAAAGLYEYNGVDRRFQLKGEEAGIAVYDDYAHHPTEIRATLQAFREKFPDRRLVVCFQPHRYSRTQMCWSDFLSAFGMSDVLFVTDIYAAGEAPIDGVSGEKLAQEIQHKDARFMARGADAAGSYAVPEIQRELRKGDVFITMGAGDGWKFGMDVLTKLKA